MLKVHKGLSMYATIEVIFRTSNKSSREEKGNYQVSKLYQNREFGDDYHRKNIRNPLQRLLPL